VNKSFLTTFWALRSFQSTAISLFEIHCDIGHVYQAVKSGSFRHPSTIYVKVKLSLYRPGEALAAAEVLAPRISGQSAHESDKVVVSPSHRPPWRPPPPALWVGGG
jgi:hypothetical protein